jgi:type IV pilus assembly protein PilV
VQANVLIMTKANRMNRESGFSLLEVLITIVILAVGLLGLAGLTAATMRDNLGAHNRSQAVWLAYDIIDRMRINRAAAQANAYNIALGVSSPGNSTIAEQDLTQWLTALASLPAGQGSVAPIAGGAANQFRITIQWDDSRGTGGINNQQFVVDTQI